MSRISVGDSNVRYTTSIWLVIDGLPDGDERLPALQKALQQAAVAKAGEMLVDRGKWAKAERTGITKDKIRVFAELTPPTP